jgi:hypothetical protein
LAEDRERFQQLLHKLGLKQPHNGTARSRDEAFAVAKDVGYPLVIRPSFVLGGRAMEIIRDDAQLERYIATAVQVSGSSPVLLDSYLSGAIEVDVDALCDGQAVHVAGIMEHIEEAGVHSGDSACSLPPHSLKPDIIADLHDQYYGAGADISETNTFSATTIAQDDYLLGSLARELNLAGARVAREAADKFATPAQPRFVFVGLEERTRARFEENRRQDAWWQAHQDQMMLDRAGRKFPDAYAMPPPSARMKAGKFTAHGSRATNPHSARPFTRVGKQRLRSKTMRPQRPVG